MDRPLLSMCLAFVVVFVLSSGALVSGDYQNQQNQKKCNSSRKIVSAVQSPYYNLLANLSYGRDGSCKQKLQIIGKGMRDWFTLPCTNIGKTTINSEKYLIYENPESSFYLFSDSPSTLIVLMDGQCTRKTYVAVKRRVTSILSIMSYDECQNMVEKIKQVKNTNLKQVEEWRKALEEKNKQDGTGSNNENAGNSGSNQNPNTPIGTDVNSQSSINADQANSQTQNNDDPQPQDNKNPQPQDNENPQRQDNENPQRQDNENPQPQGNENLQRQDNENPQRQVKENPQRQYNENQKHQIYETPIRQGHAGSSFPNNAGSQDDVDDWNF